MGHQVAVWHCVHVFHINRIEYRLVREVNQGSNWRLTVDPSDVYDDRLNSIKRILETVNQNRNNVNPDLTKYLTKRRIKTTKKDFLDLLSSDGRYYLPSERNIGAEIIKKFLKSSKIWLKFTNFDS